MQETARIYWKSGIAAQCMVVLLLAHCSGNDSQSKEGCDGGSPVVSPASDWRSLTTEPGDHRYRQGDSLCCAKGECAACCSRYDGSGACTQHGGLYGACLKEGETGEFKLHCVHCCSGLTRTPRTTRNDQGICTEVGPPSVQTCFNCGDGICSQHESSCTCEADCPR
jgi:hypothetical protein